MAALYIHRRKLMSTMYNPFQKLPYSTLSTTEQKPPLQSPSNTSQHIVNFCGKVLEATVTNQASQVENWISNVRTLYQTPLVVGMDCEWKPSFIKGSKLNNVALLQLCVDNKCLILQLFHMDIIPLMLKEFLNDSNISFVGVGLKADVTKLRKQYTLDFSCIQDITDLVKNSTWSSLLKRPGNPTGMKELASKILNLSVNKPKNITCSNWETRVLREDQIKYACVDAYISYQMGFKLLSEVENLKQVELGK